MNRNDHQKLNRLYRRDPWLDHLRGATLVSMIAYHGCWDLVYLLGFDWDWYKGTGAWLWQQSICWTFILLSGYCWPIGRHHLKRGLMTFGAGALVSLVTIIAMPSSMILCGVLTLLGSATLLMIPLDWMGRKISETTSLRFSPKAGIVLNFLLFLVFRSVNSGWLGLSLGGKIGGIALVQLPEAWYHLGLVGAWLGFMPRGFFSTDYFSVLPWFFLFCVGYFLRKEKERSRKTSFAFVTGEDGLWRKWGFVNPVLDFMGRHSLMVYLIHQPVLYGVTVLLSYLM